MPEDPADDGAVWRIGADTENGRFSVEADIQQ
jgi:hypothetical protein